MRCVLFSWAMVLMTTLVLMYPSDLTRIGGEAPTGLKAEKNADFVVKKSVLLARFHEFDKVTKPSGEFIGSLASKAHDVMHSCVMRGTQVACRRTRGTASAWT